MTPEQLKASILQAAIQGKLVEQRPEEVTAEELYQQIQEEKKKLIKEGKIKKEKTFEQIDEYEIPFEIPESWKWVRLGQCGCFERGSGIKKNETTPTGYPCVRYGQLYTTYRTRFSESVSHVPQDVFDKCKKAYKNDILMALTGENEYDIALAVTYEGDEKLAIGGDMTRFFNHCMNPLYLTYVINSRYGILCKSKMATGNIIVHISNDRLANIPIPLPPLEEQYRIVAKIEELLPYVDRYAVAYEKLEHFNARFPEDMRKSILQYAIQGKLVEQRPEEGTAEELYQQIQEEKQKLIKEGKIKKEKPLTEITDDEIPFDIPYSWKWVRLGNVCWYIDAGKSPNCSKTPAKSDQWGVITTTAVQLGFFDEKQNKVLPDNYEIKESMQIKDGDILITRAGPVNRTGIACKVNKINYSLILSDKTLRINMTDKYICKEFIVILLNSPQVRSLLIEKMTGMDKQQVNISQDKYKTVMLPLPPLKEQQRIVAKIEELLPYCDRLQGK